MECKCDESESNHETRKLQCMDCNKKFRDRFNLERHISLVHKSDKAYVRPKFQCIDCAKNFRDRFNFKRHISLMHEKDKANEICPVCAAKIYSKWAHQHFETHGIFMETELLKFDDKTKFQKWKAEVEKDTNSMYVMRCPPRTLKSEVLVTKYICHRSGYFKSKGQGLRALKVRGSNKINAYCPAEIVVQTFPSGAIEATFQKTHVGHTNDVGRLMLSKEEKTAIATKIAMRVPMDEILDDIRNNMEPKLSRIDLTTRKDVYNIIKLHNLNNDGVLHAEDAVSVDAWFARMRAHSGFVKLYKPQGSSLPEFPQFDEQDFCLILSNEPQAEALKMYGNDIICVDGTHGTNNYNFQLYTVLVLDDLREGFPCAFMVSNRGDTVVMQVYFEMILKSISGTRIKPQWFMSDMDDCFFNAWVTVCGPGTKQLYCSWHVDRAWRQAISKIQGPEKQIETYKKLKVLMFERDRNTFQIMKCNLRKELHAEKETQRFAAYFEKYFTFCERWAYCHRIHAGINTNMSLENLHRNLKHIYLKGKKVKRLDKGIHALMRFLDNKMRDRIIAICRGKVPQKLSALRVRHKTSLLMSDEQVVTVDQDLWTVTSSRNTEFYSVSKSTDLCSCDLRCIECNCCIHTFSCTCADSSILWNMCKHIHLVCRVTRQIQTVSPSFDSKNEATSPVQCGEATAPELCSEATALIQHLSTPIQTRKPYVCDLEKLRAKIGASFSETLSSVKTREGLEALQRHIAPLQFIVNSAEEKAIAHFPQASEMMEETQKRNLSPQRKFYSTKKKSVCKKSKFSNPSGSESDAIAFSMITGVSQDHSV